jgi:hypothetical protein
MHLDPQHGDRQVSDQSNKTTFSSKSFNEMSLSMDERIFGPIELLQMWLKARFGIGPDYP